MMERKHTSCKNLTSTFHVFFTIKNYSHFSSKLIKFVEGVTLVILSYFGHTPSTKFSFSRGFPHKRYQKF